jgi:membrane dipeptidase
MLRLLICLLAALIASAADVDPKLWKQAVDIHKRSIVMDAHMDAPLALILPGRDIGKRWQGGEPGTGNVDIYRLREGGVNVTWMPACVHPVPESRAPESPLRGLESLDVIYSDILDRYPDDFELALTVSDVRRIRAKGKIAVLIALESGDIIGGSIRALRMFQRLGVRYITLTHNWANTWIDSSSAPEKWGGMNDLGRQIIREMNRLGVIPDVSHVSDKAFDHVIQASEGPVIASHSGARALSNFYGRNLTDDQIRRLAAKGGVVNINFSPALISQAHADAYTARGSEFLPKLYAKVKELWAQYPNDPEKVYEERMHFMTVNGYPYPAYTEIIDHVEHIVKLVGFDHVGIGSDFDGNGMLARQMEDCSKLPFLTYELLRRGYKEPDIRKFLGENMLRVLGQAEETARRLQRVNRPFSGNEPR